MDLSSKWALLDPSYRLRLILKPTFKRLRALQSVLSSNTAIQQTFLFATRLNAPLTPPPPSIASVTDFSSIYQWIVRMISSFTLIRLPTDLTVIAPSGSTAGWQWKTSETMSSVVQHEQMFDMRRIHRLSWLCHALHCVSMGKEREKRLLNFISALPHDLAIWNFVYSMNFSISFLLSPPSVCMFGLFVRHDEDARYSMRCDFLTTERKEDPFSSLIWSSS